MGVGGDGQQRWKLLYLLHGHSVVSSVCLCDFCLLLGRRFGWPSGFSNRYDLLFLLRHDGPVISLETNHRLVYLSFDWLSMRSSDVIVIGFFFLSLVFAPLLSLIPLNSRAGQSPLSQAIHILSK